MQAYLHNDVDVVLTVASEVLNAKRTEAQVLKTIKGLRPELLREQAVVKKLDPMFLKSIRQLVDEQTKEKMRRVGEYIRK